MLRPAATSVAELFDRLGRLVAEVGLDNGRVEVPIRDGKVDYPDFCTQRAVRRRRHKPADTKRATSPHTISNACHAHYTLTQILAKLKTECDALLSHCVVRFGTLLAEICEGRIQRIILAVSVQRDKPQDYAVVARLFAVGGDEQRVCSFCGRPLRASQPATPAAG